MQGFGNLTPRLVKEYQTPIRCFKISVFLQFIKIWAFLKIIILILIHFNLTGEETQGHRLRVIYCPNTCWDRVVDPYLKDYYITLLFSLFFSYIPMSAHRNNKHSMVSLLLKK